MKMSLEIYRLAELSNAALERWRDLLAQRAVPSPFLHPEFARVAAAAGGNVEVAVWQQNGRPVAFLPFERLANGGQPVAAGLNEHQAVIAEPGFRWSGRQLLQAAGLERLELDHLEDGQAAQFGGVVHRQGTAPYADLANGFEFYAAERKASGSRVLTETARKARKLERELGTLEFRLHVADDNAFAALLRWKSAQHQRTGVQDVFQQPQVVRLLDAARQANCDGFQGLFSALYAGQRLLAVHLGLMTPRVAHVWYPAYDQYAGKYSPGMVLLVRMMEAIAERGVKRLDFGPGPQRYKRQLMSAADPIAIRVQHRGRLLGIADATVQTTRSLLSSAANRLPSPLAAAPRNLLTRIRQWWSGAP